MKIRSLILIGVLVFLAGTVVMAPVSVLHAWLLPRLANLPVQLEGLSGSIARGSVAQVSFQGRPQLRDLHWKLQPLQFLLGRASLHLTGGADGTLVDGVVYALPSGTVGLRDFRSSASVKSAFAAVGQSFVPVEGNLSLNLSSLKLRDRWPSEATGTINAQGVAWKLGRDAIPLGDYEIDVQTLTGGIKADIRSLSGALEIKGGAVLNSERHYEADVQLRPRPEAPPEVARLLGGLGSPDPQGWYHLRQVGDSARRVPAGADPLLAEPVEPAESP